MPSHLMLIAMMISAPDASYPAELNPVAYPAAHVTAGQARFTVLTPAMVRMEWSPDGKFEDRASFAFINRRLPVPKFRSSTTDGTLTLVTDELTLRYRVDGGAFGKDNLSIEFKVSGKPATWHPGMEDKGNLRGTTRTLDGVSGTCPLEPGLLSRDGWVLVDDSERLVFDSPPTATSSPTEIRNPQSEIDWPWVAPRKSTPQAPDPASPNPKSKIQNLKSQDFYFLAYDRDYKRALFDFTRVAGRIPLPPRFAFGSWWSRYWAYSDEELKKLVAEFKEHDVPLDVLVIDMEWHLDGWTGYTWNPKYFPDPQGFLNWLKGEGLRATLNLHPAEGVKKHEAAFPEFAKAMGLDPQTVDQVPFDCTDRRYVENYFKLLHHPLEKQGIDFWWMDWQQGKNTKIEGLDPLFWLNYLHWTDMERGTRDAGLTPQTERGDKPRGSLSKRPMLFSRWGGLGNHRYQIGFSGDTFSNWASLAFQPYFTSTAGNVGYAYWSHDIGGHQPGAVDPELYARWIQFGAFSPALRTHTTKNPKAERRIWEFPGKDAPPSKGGDEGGMFTAARKAFHLRYELIPYTYSMARKCYDTGLPLCRPLYYEWPELDESYTHAGQYLFGDDLLVAPVAQPISPLSGTAEVDVWIPPGEWTNWFTGRTYTGPTMATLMVPLDEIPLFVRSGGIIPAQPKMSRTNEKPVDPLVLHVFPGASGETRIYEDDGESTGYQKNECAWTPVSVRVDADGTRRIAIGPTEGDFAGMPKQRQYEIRVHGVWPAAEVKADGAILSLGFELPCLPIPPAPSRSYEPTSFTEIIRLAAGEIGRKTEIEIRFQASADRAAFLKRGFRGILDSLDDLMEATADPDQRGPEPLCMHPALVLAEHPELAEEWIRDWNSNGIDAPPTENEQVQQRAFLLLHGISCRLDAVPAHGGASVFSIKAQLATTQDLVSLSDLSAKIELFADPPWQVEGTSNWDVMGLSEQKPFIATSRVRVPDQLASGVLRAQIELHKGKLSTRLALTKPLLPSINAWWVLGPFDCPFETKGLDCVFPPEEKIDLDATYDGKDGKKIGWKEAKRSLAPGADLTDEFFVHLHDFYGQRHQNAIAYALCYLHAPRAMDASLAIGSDDGVAVWLNGKEVHRSTVGRPYSPKQDRVQVKLNEGVNTLLLKVSQGGGDWGFGVHVETPDGKPLPEVQTTLSPKN